MITKLANKFAVFYCDLTLVAKYAFSQAPSHLEIRLASSEGDSATGSSHSLLSLLSFLFVRILLQQNTALLSTFRMSDTGVKYQFFSIIW